MIRKISVRNFKSIKNGSVELPDFAFLIGKNGAGKTNLLNVIELTNKLVKNSTISESLEGISPFPSELYYQGSDSQSSDIDLIIEANHNLYRLKYSIAFKTEGTQGKYVIENEYVSKLINGKEELIYKRLINNTVEEYKSNTPTIIPLKVNPDKLVLSSYSSPVVEDLVKSISSQVIIGSSNLGKPKVHQSISDQSPDVTTIDGVVISLKNKDNLLTKASSVISRIIPNFISPRTIDLSQVDTSSDQNKAEDKSQIVKRYLIFWPITQGQNLFTIFSHSGGDIRTCFLIYSLFNATKGSTLIVEEIENGMHLGRINKVIDEFRTQSNNQEVQVILTSHSPEVIEDVLPSEVIFCKNDIEHGSSYVNIPNSEAYRVIKADLKDKEPSINDILSSGLLN